VAIVVMMPMRLYAPEPLMTAMTGTQIRLPTQSEHQRVSGSI
jgi:hypothetical protein